MQYAKPSRRLLLFLVFFLVLLLGGPASAAEEEELMPPTVSLSAKQLVYTGSTQYVALDLVQHPLASEGHFSYSWYKDGALLPFASERLPVRDVSDSGIYYCKVVFTYNGKTSEKCTEAVEISVQKKSIEIPDIPSLIYTGNRQYPAVFSTADYTVEENAGGITAGVYSVTVSLRDKENTAFLPRTGIELVQGHLARILYEIRPAENRFTTPFSVSDCYEGSAPPMRAYAAFGEVRYRFFSDVGGESEIGVPSAPGVYYAQAYVEGTESYRALSSPILRFSLLPLSVEALRILSAPERLSYTAFELLSLSGLSLSATMADGSQRAVPLSEVSVVYPIGGGCLFAKDTFVWLCYGDARVPLPVSVKRAALDLSGVAWSAAGWVYDGVCREITLSGLPPAVSVSSYSGNRITDAGSHTVYAHLSYDRDNYEGPSALFCTLSVERQRVSPPILSPLVYDGTLQQAPLPVSPLYTAVQLPRAVHAGSYPLILRLTDPKNYVFESGGEETEVLFELLPRELTVTLEDVTLWLGEKFSAPSYTVVAGSPLAGDDLCFRAEYGSGKAVYRFENPDYLVRYEGGEVIRTYRLPPAAEAALLLGLTAILLFGLILFFLVAVLKRKRRTAQEVPVRAHTCTYPLFTREDSPSLSEQDQGYLITEQAPPPVVSDAAPVLPEEPSEEADDASVASVDAVDVSTAEALITDALAEALVMAEEREIYTDGTRHGVINVDTLSAAFAPGEEVDINRLKKKKLIAPDVGYLKVLARGSIDKPLTVYADDFSLGAIKMIALTGGRTFHVRTQPRPRA